MLRQPKKKNQPESFDNHGGHLPDYQTMRKWYAYFALEGKESRTFVICLACKIPLCLVKERNCFQKKSITFRSTYNIYLICFRWNAVVFCLVFIYFHSLFEFFIYIIFYMYIVIFSILYFGRPNVVKEM